MNGTKKFSIYNTLALVALIFYVAFVFSYIVLYLVDNYYVYSTDLVSFLTGASIIKSGKAGEIYNLTTQLSNQLSVIKPYFKTFLLPFRGLPALAVFFIPFLNLNLRYATWVFMFINFLVLLVIYTISIKHFLQLDKKKNVILFVTFCYWPAVVVMLLGQISLIVTLLVFLIYLALKRQKDFIAGILLGLLIIKFQYLLLIPFCLLISRKKLTLITGSMLSAISFLLLSVFLSGTRTLLEYVPFLLKTETLAFGSRPYHMFTLYGSIFSHLSVPGLEYLPLIVNLAVYMLALYIFSKFLRKLSLDLLFSVAVILVILFSLHTLVHDLTNFLFPVFVLTNQYFNTKSEKTRTKLAAMIAALYFLPLVILTNSTLFTPIIFLFISFYMLYFYGKESLEKNGSIS